MANETADPEKLKFFSFSVFSQLSGAVTAGMIHLGDRLGIYKEIAAHSGITSSELAQHLNMHERWIREWCSNQVAAKIIVADFESGDTLFSLSPEGCAVLADDTHPAFGMGMFHRLPATMERLSDLPTCFHTGIGFDYDTHGHDGAVGIERSFEPWSNAFLVPVVLPSIAGLVKRLQDGMRVADIGCGAGSAVLLMAAAFPQSSFVGYDISEYALGRAREKAEVAGLTNVQFVNPRDKALPDDHSIDFVTAFDCLHDMTHPRDMVSSIHKMLNSNGVWLLVDIKALDTLKENVQKNPMAALMYGISVLSCMASALSEADGEGLGTLGLSAHRAEEYARAAGFTTFTQLEITHSVNAFYEIRP